MVSLITEFEELKSSGLFPNKDFLSLGRLTIPYADVNELGTGISEIAWKPIINGLNALWHALNAVWAALRVVGNLLILKPNHAAEAGKECGIYALLTLGLTVMAPIHALSSALELLTRIISSWFTGEKEPTDDLSKLSLASRWLKESNDYTNLLPSSNYLNKSRFFSPYANAIECLEQLLVKPISTFAKSGLGALLRALVVVMDAIECIANLTIGKPRHAWDNLLDCGVHSSLSVSLAVMAVVNPLIEGIAFVSRLSSTWVSSCMQPETEVSDREDTDLDVAPAMSPN